MGAYKPREAGIIALHIFAADKIAELETVNKKSCFHSTANEVERNLRPIVTLLLDAIGQASLPQLCEKLQHTFKAAFHWLAPSRVNWCSRCVIASRANEGSLGG